ncbi:MAG: hypothetical protein L6R41_008048 [Letrouitia leprolyta]|nr:MAG: hypothetical protein L6R41_008048 [Letrouitia leprolyta]
MTEDELSRSLLDRKHDHERVGTTSAPRENVTNTDKKIPNDSGENLASVESRRVSSDGVLNDINTIYRGMELAAEEFRILLLQAAQDRAEAIHCRLVKVHPRTKPNYEALSYTWGESRDKRTISVNGQNYMVTPNLYAALEHLRKAEGDRTLWIDAICIDQSSLLEKTHQVGMMRDIYRDAFRVLTWLGESDKDTCKAMAFLKHRKRFQLLTEDELDPFRPGLAKLFERPWWSRIWVVQEFLVATEPPLLGCGRDWLSWVDLEVGMMNLQRQQIPGVGAESFLKNPMGFYDLGSMSSSIVQGGQKTELISSRNGTCSVKTAHETILDSWSARQLYWSLEHLLAATCNRNTTQPHDKIFSLLGLTPGSVLEEVPINYDRPCTESYQKAMLHVLRRNMKFLVNAMHRPKADNIPS